MFGRSNKDLKEKFNLSSQLYKYYMDTLKIKKVLKEINNVWQVNPILLNTPDVIEITLV